MDAEPHNTTEQDFETEIVRLEPNVEELPIFSATKRSRGGEVVVRSWTGRDPATGRPIEQGIVLRPAAGLGLPAERERDLYYLCLAPLIEAASAARPEEFRATGKVGPIRYNDACRALGWRRSGQNYEQVREAVKTLASLTLELTNAVIDGRTRRLLTIVDKFMSAAVYEESVARAKADRGEQYELRRGEFYVKLAEWFRENHLNNYLKPTDLGPYRQLRSAIAKALYGMLDKRAYSTRTRQYRPEVRLDLLDLRERFRLGVRETKELLREFRSAHEELVRAWPALKRADIEKLAPGRYECVYRFTPQTELALEDEPAPSLEQGSGPSQSASDTPLVDELARRGVTIGVARRLVRQHDEMSIRRQLDVHDQEVARGQRIENPGGRLHQRIREGWEPFDGYHTPEEREALAVRRRSYQDRRGRDEAERRAEEDRFEALTAEEKVEEKLGEWIRRRELMGKMGGQPLPTEEERTAEQKRLLAVYGGSTGASTPTGVGD